MLHVVSDTSPQHPPSPLPVPHKYLSPLISFRSRLSSYMLYTATV